jgi:hypothetical protein
MLFQRTIMIASFPVFLGGETGLATEFVLWGDVVLPT